VQTLLIFAVLSEDFCAHKIHASFADDQGTFA